MSCLMRAARGELAVPLGEQGPPFFQVPGFHTGGLGRLLWAPGSGLGRNSASRRGPGPTFIEGEPEGK